MKEKSDAIRRGYGHNLALQCLTEGRALLAKGWLQGDFIDADGSVCALGAIGYRSSPGNPDPIEYEYEPGFWAHVFRKKPRILPSPSFPIPPGRAVACAALVVAVGTEDLEGWNDAEERTLEDVLEAFDRAIALAAAYQPDQAIAIDESK